MTKDEAINIASALIRSTGMADLVNYGAVRARFVEAMKDPEGIYITHPQMYIKLNDYWEMVFPFFHEQPIRGTDVAVTVDSISKEAILLP